MSLIARNKYAKILEVLPILCIDVAVQNMRGEYFLVKRLNEPKKGKWWVIGGRVLKGDAIEHAVKRKVKEETGLRVKNMRPIGYFELINVKNPFGSTFKYHTISIVFAATIDDFQAIKLDNQSVGFKFAKKLPPDFYIKSF